LLTDSFPGTGSYVSLFNVKPWVLEIAGALDGRNSHTNAEKARVGASRKYAIFGEISIQLFRKVLSLYLF
jgi:hypothetical protein